MTTGAESNRTTDAPSVAFFGPFGTFTEQALRTQAVAGVGLQCGRGDLQCLLPIDLTQCAALAQHRYAPLDLRIDRLLATAAWH